jgi:uroporphyrinogen decarboxylase
MKAFRHEEPDFVPVFEQLVVSKVSSEILGRYTCTGGGEFARSMIEALLRGERNFLVEKYKEDIVELHQKLGLDAVCVELVPGKDAFQNFPKKIAENTYCYKDTYGEGTFEIRKFNLISGEFFTIDSSIRREGMDIIKKFCRLLEKKMQEPVVLEEDSWEAVDYVRAKVGKEKAICISHAMAIPVEAPWLEALLLQPKLVEMYLDYQLRQSLALVEEAAKHGVDFIMGGGDLADDRGTIYSPCLFERITLPRFKKLISFCHKMGLFYIFRTDGNTKPIWKQLFIDSGADGYGEIQPTAGMDLAELKKELPHLTLWGNLDCGETLVNGSKERIFRETEDCMEKGRPGGGYIFGSSNAIHYGVPAKNFLYMLEAAKKYGKYG